MDILSQYKQEHPEALQEKRPLPMTDEYGRAYSGMIALAMRLSGGRIRDPNQAARVLLIAAGTIATIALVVYMFGSSGGIKQPAQDLINRPQPQPPLPR